jgi:hypothetical protein
MPMQNGVIGEYFYISKDLHHPTLSKLSLAKTQQFKERRSTLLDKPHLIVDGYFRISYDTLFLEKNKFLYKPKRKFLTKGKVTKCFNNLDEFECEPDTFLIRKDGLYEFQYFMKPEKNGWVLTYRKE